MAEFPYSLSVGRMQQFLKDIPTIKTPDKLIVKTLEERGLKSTNDRTIIPTLKFLGLIDDAGIPTEKWRALRDQEKYGASMAQIIREAYSGLFDAYPDAPNRSDKEIQNYIGAHTDAAMRMVGAMVSVFKMLCSLSDFEAEPVSVEDVAANRPPTDRLDRGTQRLSPPDERSGSGQGQVSVQLNLTLSENASSEQIEAVFKHAAKYLLGRKEDVN